MSTGRNRTVSLLVIVSVMSGLLVVSDSRSAIAQPYCQNTVNHPTYGTFYDCLPANTPPPCGYYSAVRTKDTPIGQLQLRYSGGNCRHAQAALYYYLSGSFLNLWALRHSNYPAGNTLGLPLDHHATTQWETRILNDRNMLVRAIIWRNLWVAPDMTTWF